MSIIEFIEKLQKKPHWVRVRVMWTAVAVCMVFIFVFWIWLLGRNLSKQTVQTAGKEETSNAISQLKEDIPTLWQSLSAGVSSVFQTLKQELGSQSETAQPGDETQSNGSQENSTTNKLPIE